jgi:hypothetical protein
MMPAPMIPARSPSWAGTVTRCCVASGNERWNVSPQRTQIGPSGASVALGGPRRFQKRFVRFRTR